MLTTIVRHDSVPSSLCSSGADEEAAEGGAAPSMPGIKTTERRRMQSLESHPETDLPESRQQEGEVQDKEEEEEEEHRHKQHTKQKGWPPAGVVEEGQLSSSDGKQGSANSPWATASSGGVVSPSWGNAEQAAAVHASENGGDERSQALQAMCARLEQQAEAERLAGAKARQQLVAAQREIEALKAEQAAQRQQQQQQQPQQPQQQPQPTEVQGEVGELHRRVQEAEMIAAGIKRSNEALTQELEGTKQACARLENLVRMLCIVEP
ncbi:hypothetical protein DUNSADRAFT_12719 [Dunaliella salina]|uniref:Uncharacterized protein n=1 Tax=Dunaliella salina TaxID=3046 RepID=A0ABQ7GAT5_DUNSA|nr:hypothetical protein DUNSADRAFT_12719 [Dunaliella salina]|eukprot:KAF5831697.1 hypothetical protein DUNSADRAFT_12719 [Dunaliella salina]